VWEGGEHTLTDTLILAETLDDLEIGVRAGAFDAEKHADSFLASRMSRISGVKSTKFAY
jgi:hypothetical protein